jgi:stress response protein YsnF
LTREQVRHCPAYDEAATVDRAYEQQLHDACGRAGYWI